MLMHRDRRGLRAGQSGLSLLLAGVTLTWLSPVTNAQTSPPAAPAPAPAPTKDAQPIDPAQPDEVPEWIRRAAPDDPGVKLYAQHQKLRFQSEKELRKIRATHFKNIRNAKIRAEGIVKLYDYDQPALYPSLIEIFQHEGEDVRTAILDMFVASGSDEGDASLAWVAVESSDPEFQDMAKARLLQRVSAGHGASNRIRLVIMQGLRSQNDSKIASAAGLAHNLGLFEAIPWLIQAQVGGTQTGSGGGGGDRRGALAYILVGQQQAFISDLTPVVGESAVAFDPQLSTLTTGTILQVFDAVVVTYRTEVHSALLGLSEGLTGRNMGGLGWDQRLWWDWYKDEGKGMIAAKTAVTQPADPPK